MAASTERIVVNLSIRFIGERHPPPIEKKIYEKHSVRFDMDSIETRSKGENSYLVAAATRTIAIAEVRHGKDSPTKESASHSKCKALRWP